MVTLDYDGNVIAIVGGLGEKNKSLSLNRAYSVTRQTGSTIKPIGAYALGVEYGLVNWSTMLNNSPLYQKQDMVIRDEDYCRKNGLMGLSDKQLRAYPNAWRSWPRNYGGNYGDNSDVPLWNGLARSLNTICARPTSFTGSSVFSCRVLYTKLKMLLAPTRSPYDMTKTLGKQQAKTRTCVMAWKALMEQVQADLPYKAFPTSAGVVERRYCTQSGLLAGGSCPSTAVGYYRADDLPGTCNYSHAAAPAAAPAAAAPAETAAPEQAVIPADTGNQDTD